MGMKLVGLVLTKWAPYVPDRAFRVLTRMAMTALDEASEKMPASLYFGGRDLLIACLNAERSGTIDSLERTLKRAINDLIRLGAIERTNRAYSGERAVYRLTLEKPIRIDELPVDNSGKGDSGVPKRGTPTGTHRGTPESKKGDTHRYPKEKEEPLEEQQEEIRVSDTEPVAVRARDAEAPNENEIEPRCRNPECLNGSVIDKSKPKGKRVTPCSECQAPPDNVIQFGRRTA